MAYNKEYNQYYNAEKRNKDKQRERSIRYYYANKEKILDYWRRYRAENKEKAQSYRDKNKDKAREYNRQYYFENVEKAREWHLKYYAANSEHIKESRRNYMAANKLRRRETQHRRNARIKAQLGIVSPNIIKTLFREQSGFCNNPYCVADLVFVDYHLDHIMPLALGGLHEDGNLQLLCSGCNQTKHAKHPDEWDCKKYAAVPL